MLLNVDTFKDKTWWFGKSSTTSVVLKGVTYNYVEATLPDIVDILLKKKASSLG